MDIVDCTGHLSEGGDKNAEFIDEHLIRVTQKAGAEHVYLCTVDGGRAFKATIDMLQDEFPWLESAQELVLEVVE